MALKSIHGHTIAKTFRLEYCFSSQIPETTSLSHQVTIFTALLPSIPSYDITTSNSTTAQLTHSLTATLSLLYYLSGPREAFRGPLYMLFPLPEILLPSDNLCNLVLVIFFFLYMTEHQAALCVLYNFLVYHISPYTIAMSSL